MSERNPFGQRNDGGWCMCAECERTFGGLSGFDLHRIPGGRRGHYDWTCASDAELEAKGLHLSPRGWWVQEPRSTPWVSTQTAVAG